MNVASPGPSLLRRLSCSIDVVNAIKWHCVLLIGNWGCNLYFVLWDIILRAVSSVDSNNGLEQWDDFIIYRSSTNARMITKTGFCSNCSCKCLSLGILCCDMLAVSLKSKTNILPQWKCTVNKNVHYLESIRISSIEVGLEGVRYVLLRSFPRNLSIWLCAVIRLDCNQR